MIFVFMITSFVLRGYHVNPIFPVSINREPEARASATENQLGLPQQANHCETRPFTRRSLWLTVPLRLLLLFLASFNFRNVGEVGERPAVLQKQRCPLDVFSGAVSSEPPVGYCPLPPARGWLFLREVFFAATKWPTWPQWQPRSH